MGFIYKMTNIITNKIYIGKTSRTIEERFQEHIKLSKTSKYYLHQSIKKHGSDSFTIESLEEISDISSLNIREKYWIETLVSLAPLGYNLTKGGDGGDTSHSINYQNGMMKRDYNGEKNPMFGKLGENNPNFGSKRTEQQKENLRVGLQEAWDTNTERRKLQSLKFSGTNNPQFGKKPPNSITIKFNGNIYYSLADAARDNNRSPQYIKKHGDVINE